MLQLSVEFVYSVLKDLWNGYRSRTRQPIVYKVKEVTVTYSEKMRSLRMDVVKVHAHDHNIGVSAEYAWLKIVYPKHKVLEQAITKLSSLTGKSLKHNDIPFDIISIELEGGRHKKVYFDIGEFFSVWLVPSSKPGAYAATKLSQLYGR